jgi:hypothetical protein
MPDNAERSTLPTLEEIAAISGPDDQIYLLVIHTRITHRKGIRLHKTPRVEFVAGEAHMQVNDSGRIAIVPVAAR